MRNFFVEEIAAIDGLCLITGAEARHISRVLRMRPGDRLILMDKKGSRFQACIESITAWQVKIRVEKPLEMPRPSTFRITLCQAITKSQSMDYIIQKTSELGVDCIVPFFPIEALSGSIRTGSQKRWCTGKGWRKTRPNSAAGPFL